MVLCLRHCPPLPPVSSAPVGAARSRPGRQVGDPYQAQKLLACSNQRDTTYSPFTLTYYLRPRRWAMPGGLGNLRIDAGSAASLSVAQPFFSPNFLHTGRGGSKPPGSPGWRPLPGSKAFGLQQPTGYHLFTIHSYLLPSPTQVGDAGRVRELTYSYKPRSVIVCRHSSPRPRFPPCIESGGSGNQCIGTSPAASLSVVTDDKKSLADWPMSLT